MVKSAVSVVAANLRRHSVLSAALQLETEMVIMSLAMPWLQSYAAGYVAVDLLPFNPLGWLLRRMIIR
jgi:hypothetical protein